MREIVKEVSGYVAPHLVPKMVFAVWDGHIRERGSRGRLREMFGAVERVHLKLGERRLLMQRLCVDSHRTSVVSSNFYVTARTSARGSWRRSGYVTALVHNTPVAA